MTTKSVLRSVLLAAAVLSVGACATQPPEPLSEKLFQRTANDYTKYQHEGLIVYCKRGATRSLPPSECVTEPALRQRVEDTQRTRNAVAYGGPPYVATVPGGSGT
jgi:hypothetical protein